MSQCSKSLYNPSSTMQKLSMKKTLTDLVKGISQEGLDNIKSKIKLTLQKYHKPNSKTTVSADENVTDEQIKASVNSIMDTLKEVLDTVNMNVLTKNEILDYFSETLNLSLDASQKYSTKEYSDEEIKTMQEAAEKNSENLENHFNSLYGKASTDVINKIKEIFIDSITNIAYYNPATGSIAPQNNETLNKEIQKLKSDHFRTLIQYLKATYSEDPLIEGLSEELFDNDGNLDSENYYIAITQFYKKYKEDTTKFKDNIFLSYSKKISEESKQEKLKYYKELIKIVKEELSDKDNDVYKTFLDSYGYSGAQLSNIDITLFEADHYSNYYENLKEFLEYYTMDQGIKEKVDSLMEKIEHDHTSLFEASTAYSILTQFDNLIEDTLGKQIAIKEDLKNFEINSSDKYFYYKDSAHERKSWQTSEDSSSEKHLSRFTKSIMNIIRIYNHKTGEFQNRRATTSTYISAVRNIFNAVESGSLDFGSSKSAEELRKLVRTFKGHPVENLKRISEILFEENLSKEAGGNYVVSEADWNVMKSVYTVVFDKKNPKSFYSQSNEVLKGYSRTAQQLIEEVASLIDRNASSNQLETEVDFETGNVNVKVKKKYSTGKEFIQLTTGINSYINNITLEKRKKLANKYKYSIENGKGNTLHIVDIGEGIQLKVSVPNNADGGILAFKSKDKIKVELENLDNLSKIDLVQFRQKIISNNLDKLTEDELKLKKVLEFLDDFLDLNLLLNGEHNLQVLNSYKQIYRKDNEGNYDNWLQPLLKMATKSVFANFMYIDADAKDLSLKEYLKTNQFALFNASQKVNRTPVTSKFNDLKFVIASYIDKVLEIWVDAGKLLVGENQKSTIKDRQGNALPNLSVNKLANNVQYYLHKQSEDDSVVRSLWFATNKGTLIGTVNDLESVNFEGESKSVKNFSLNELFYHSVFNKFLGTYLSNTKGNVIVQPTTYSDKTTFPNWEISTKVSKNDLMEKNVDEMVDLYNDSIGNYYDRLYDKTVEKLTTIVDEFFKDKEFLPENFNFMTLNQKLHLMSEQDLVKTAAKLGLSVEEHTEYRNIKNEEGKSVVGFNELLAYNKNLYLSKEKLKERLEIESKYFIEGLLSTNAHFKVLDFRDDYSTYLEENLPENLKSKNVIINTILKFTKTGEDRIKYFKNWVDEDTGNLILAKQKVIDPNTGKEIFVPIIDNSSHFDINLETELNPLLSKFFYVEGFLSNNLRMSLTGSEISHPAGKKGPFNTYKKLAKSNSNKDDWSRVLGYNVDAKIVEELNKILNSSLDLSDVIEELEVLYSLPVPSDSDEALIVALDRIIDNSAIYNTNTSQGTQFKRNVIITATLQYLTPDSIEGPPSEIEVAVIKDEQAPVYNYRGDHEGTIDANDGAAKITAFQSIMENKALGSQAVGFTKKPIWHDYDPKTGTVFLAKFATNTITNEEMRLSIGSNSSTYNLFKKMTNIPWDEPVDLTKPITSGKSLGGNGTSDLIYKRWFDSVILRNSELFYTDKYGEVVQILQLNKESFGENKENTVYYTEEKDSLGNINKVYHLFYDTVDSKSVHSTFNSLEDYQKAFEHYSNIEGSNPHTINSLFELHSSLGGIYCCDSKGVSSEFNNEVVVNFMNFVGEAKEGTTESDYIDQTHYYQPLKKFHIGYALNKSSVKVGARNINPAESWSDSSSLTTYKVKSLSLGMQMNADHDVVNSELTEFSQVIAATSAYGYTYGYTNEIFQGLAKTAFEASEPLLKSLDNFLKNMKSGDKEKAISLLYDAVGRIMLVNESIKDKGNLTKIIMEGVKKIFDTYDLHTKDDVKIPFSDPNVYGEFISTLASTITKNSIKRKHIGVGAVIVPSYNIAQTYNLLDKDGNRITVLADDVLKKALKDYKEELIQVLVANSETDENKNKAIINGEIVYLKYSSISELEKLVKTLPQEAQNSISYKFGSSGLHETNKVLFETYLAKYQHPFKSADYFMPSDIVEVLDADGNSLKTVDLNSMETYYKFKEDVQNNAFGEGAKFRIHSRKPSNLRPSLIRWQYVENDNFELGTDPETGKVQYFNIEDTKTLDGIIVQPFEEKLNDFETVHSAKVYLENKTEKGYFEIIKDTNSNNYFISFKAGVDESGNPYTLNNEDKDLFYETLKRLLPNGALISTLNDTNSEEIKALEILGKNWVNTGQYKEVTDSNGNSLKVPIYQKAVIKYMNIFDMPAIKNAFLQSIDTNTPAHRKAVQDILHDLHEGKFTIDGKTYNILEGTLENEPAELIMGNIYKEIFGIENESLAEVLEEGEAYFKRKIQNIKAPASNIYDIAFLKPNGKNTLISLRKVKPSQSVTEIGFQHTITNDKGEIFQLKKGEPGILIGKWVTVEDSSVTYDQTQKIFESTKGIEINQNDYRLVDGKVQKKVEFVKRFSVLSKKMVGKSPIFVKETLFEIANENVIEEAYKGLKKEETKKIKADIIKTIYTAGDFSFPHFNFIRDDYSEKNKKRIVEAVSSLVEDIYVDSDVREMLKSQIEAFTKADSKFDSKTFKEIKEKFAETQSKKQWVSFQDSLKMIASRIPAQTLQSFMAMKLVGWNKNSTNMAYVSHFQTYLQGSDYQHYSV